jgi:hypothetical protein
MNYIYIHMCVRIIGVILVLIAYRFKDCYYDYGFRYIYHNYRIDRTVHRTRKFIIRSVLNRLIVEQERHLSGVVCTHRSLIIEICKRFVFIHSQLFYIV